MQASPVLEQVCQSQHSIQRLSLKTFQRLQRSELQRGLAIAKRFLQEGAAKVVMLCKGSTIDKELRRQVDSLKQELNYADAQMIALAKS